MNKEFVPKKESKELQQLGFDEDCLAFYNGNFLESTEYDFDSCNSKEVGLCTKAPTFSQAFRWFREKHDLHCWPEITGSNRYLCRYDGNDDKGYRWVGYLKDLNGELLFHQTYLEAELSCLRKLIEIVK